MRTSRRAIEQFLSLHRIAVAGVSRQEVIYRPLCLEGVARGRGYDLVPLNPNADWDRRIAGRKTIAEIDPPPEGVMLMVPPAAIACAGAGKRSSMGSARPLVRPRYGLRGEAVDLPRSRVAKWLVGECPLMFLEKTGFPHSWHRALRIVTLTMPR